MKNPIGVNTWVWVAPFTTRGCRLFGKIKRMGFDMVEIPVEDPSLIDAKRVKAALDEHGLGCTVCGAFGPTRDLTHDRVSVQKQGLAYIRRCLRLAKTWDAKVFAGPMYSAVGKARLVPAAQRRKERARAVKNLRTAAKMAADAGVTLGLEPLNRFETDLVNTAKQAVDLVTRVGHPSLRIHLDTFHMNIEEQDTAAAIGRCRGKLVHVHASESDRGTPGAGQVDWKSLAAGLKKIKYKGPVVIETFTPTVKEIARAAAIWRPLAPSQDRLARDGLKFLRSL